MRGLGPTSVHCFGLGSSEIFVDVEYVYIYTYT